MHIILHVRYKIRVFSHKFRINELILNQKERKMQYQKEGY